jgi:ComF family protein
VRLLDVLLPQRCAVCGRGERLLCARCLGDLPLLPPPLCARCGTPTAWPVERCSECAGRRISFASARSAVAYDDVARALVRAWKERGIRALTANVVRLTAEAVPAPAGAEAVAFVPGDGDRTRWRGHSTAEALARGLAERWELPLVPALRRGRRSERQRGLSREHRRANVRGAFEPAGSAPRRLVLVDDVYTTGATANAASSALRRGGAREVHVVTFARALRGG